MHYCAMYLTCLVFLWNYFSLVDSNALLTPTSRGMMWTRNSFNSAGYNYMEINCGGVHRLKQTNGHCGLCGDPFNAPREHETGGKYATGAIAHVLHRGERNMKVKVLLNVDLGGYFEFRLCASNGTTETQECFDKNLLKITEGRAQGDEYAYVVQHHGMIALDLEIPEKLYCERCVLQWKYVTGNTFGWDDTGRGCIGCGIQDTYINCADVTIRGWEMPVTLPPPTTPIPTTTPTTTPLPPTTTTPAPPSTKRMNYSSRQSQFQSQRVAPSQTTRYVTRQSKKTVTDFDEGSRIRSNGGGSVHSKAYAPVPAPQPQTPAVSLPSATESASVAEKPVQIVGVAQVPADTKAQIPSPTTKAPPPNAKDQSKAHLVGLLNIPRPPKLSDEQIFALNNNKNVLPHHDPLQKYVKVGNSRIVAGHDFTTVKALQMPTPPPPAKNQWKPQATDSTVHVSTRSIPPRQINKHQGPPPEMQMFGSFNSEMLGAPSTKNTPYAHSQMSTGFDAFGSFGNEMSGGAIIPGKRGSLLNAYDTYNSQNQQNRWPGPSGLKSHTGYVQTNVLGNSFSDRFGGNAGMTPMSSRNTGTIQDYGKTRYQNQQVQTQSANRHIAQDKYVSKHQAGIQYIIPQAFEVDIYGRPISSPSKDSSNQRSQTSGYANKLQLDMTSNTGYGTNQAVSPNSDFMSFQSNRHSNDINSLQSKLSNYMPHQAAPHISRSNHPERLSNEQNRRSTKLPVIDTSTHRNTDASNIAPWRNPPVAKVIENKKDYTNVPVNLFRGEDRRLFKAPAIKERFTNYQIGGGGSGSQQTKTRSVSTQEINGQQTQQNINNERFGQESQTYKNIHLNTGIHSPENYFGQDHYLAQNTEQSYPPFGGSDTSNIHTAQNYNLNQNSEGSGPVMNPPHSSVQTFNSMYGKQGHFDTGSQLPFYNAQKPKVSTTTLDTAALESQSTTNQMDYQMQEIKKLREKLERLQLLLSDRQQETLQQTTFALPATPRLQIPRQTTGSHSQNSLANQNLFIQSTPPPSMNKKTTQFIELFKAQMLQSIEKANSRGSKTGSNRDFQGSVVSKRQNSYQDGQIATVDNNPINSKQGQPSLIAPTESTASATKEDTYQKLLELIRQRQQQRQKAEELNSRKQQNQHSNSQNPHFQNNIFQQMVYTTPKHVRPTRQVHEFEVGQPAREVITTSTKPDLNKVNTPVGSSTKSTHVNSLADKIAARMAAKITSRGGEEPALPLADGNLMSALRKIALSVLKEQQNERKMPDITFPTQETAGVTTAEIAPKIIYNPVRLHDATMTSKTEALNIEKPIAPLNNSQTELPSTSTTDQLEAYKRRQELLNRMKLIMKFRRPAHISITDTMNNDRPSHLPNSRPTHLRPQKADESEKIRLTNNRPTHIQDHPNNRRPTIYDNPTRQVNARERLVQPTIERAGTISVKSTQLANPSHEGDATATVSNTKKLRLPPDIAKLMMHRAREIKERNSQKVQEGTTKSVPQDAISRPSNKELLLNLLKSISKNQSNSG